MCAQIAPLSLWHFFLAIPSLLAIVLWWAVNSTDPRFTERNAFAAQVALDPRTVKMKGEP